MPERANRVMGLLGPRRASTVVPSPGDMLAELGLPERSVLPVVPVVTHVPVVRAGALVLTSGQLPIRDGELVATGRVGDALDVADGRACARWCAFNALAAIRSEIGDLSRVKRVVKVVVYVASGELFTDQVLVANGASELLGQAFGDAGQHARSVVGVSVLPLGAPVELELMVEI